MRAGEAKLRGRVGAVLLNAGGSNGNIDSSGSPAQAWVAPAFVAIFVSFKQMSSYLFVFSVFFCQSFVLPLLLFAWVLRTCHYLCYCLHWF